MICGGLYSRGDCPDPLPPVSGPPSRVAIPTNLRLWAAPNLFKTQFHDYGEWTCARRVQILPAAQLHFYDVVPIGTSFAEVMAFADRRKAQGYRGGMFDR